MTCRISCSGEWGKNRKLFKSLYDARRWRELATGVYQIGFNEDLSWFYLGAAADGLGYARAALTYYENSLTAEHKCNTMLLNICNDLDVPVLVKNRLASLEMHPSNTAQRPAAAPPTSVAQIMPSIRCRDEADREFDEKGSWSCPKGSAPVTVTCTTGTGSGFEALYGACPGGTTQVATARSPSPPSATQKGAPAASNSPPIISVQPELTTNAESVDISGRISGGGGRLVALTVDGSGAPLNPDFPDGRAIS